MKTKVLENKVVVVTGGSGLLGSCFCQEILSHGGLVVVADTISPDQEFFNDYDRSSVIFKKTDITSATSISELIAITQETFGKIDAVVSSAYPRNKNYGKRLEDVTFEDFCENTNLHLGGYFLVMQKFAEFFCKQKQGNVLTISSIYGVRAPDFGIYEGCDFSMPVEYAAIKSALIHLNAYFATYFKGKNIRFNCISPGGLERGQDTAFKQKYKNHCLNKGLLDPQDICGTLVFLLSDVSSFINGQNIIVDDGFTL